MHEFEKNHKKYNFKASQLDEGLAYNTRKAVLFAEESLQSPEEFLENVLLHAFALRTSESPAISKLVPVIDSIVPKAKDILFKKQQFFEDFKNKIGGSKNLFSYLTDPETIDDSISYISLYFLGPMLEDMFRNNTSVDDALLAAELVSEKRIDESFFKRLIKDIISDKGTLNGASYSIAFVSLYYAPHFSEVIKRKKEVM